MLLDPEKFLLDKVMMDCVIIGGGIAGLYAAYKILQKDPNLRLVVLEREDRLGGRAHSVMFHGVSIQEGAGIGRYRKDKKLRGVLEELGLSHHVFTSHHRALFAGEKMLSVAETVKELKQAAVEPGFDRHQVTFGEFARHVLGDQKYAAFLQSCGYTDFENADILDTLEHYGFDDVGNIKGFGVPWNALVEKLAGAIGAHRIRLRTSATRIQKDPEAYLVEAGGTLLRTRRVILAGTIEMVRRLLPEYDIYQGIAAQPFARVYAKLKAPLENVQSYTLVSGHLQKIIPIHPEEGIYMIAYSDNLHALAVRDKGKRYFERLLHEATGERVQVLDLYQAFWKEGTHYFRPLPRAFKNRREFVRKAQHPANGLFVVGEAVSWRYQGWTEGALESVEAVLKKLEN